MARAGYHSPLTSDILLPTNHLLDSQCSSALTFVHVNYVGFGFIEKQSDAKSDKNFSRQLLYQDKFMTKVRLNTLT